MSKKEKWVGLKNCGKRQLGGGIVGGRIGLLSTKREGEKGGRTGKNQVGTLLTWQKDASGKMKSSMSSKASAKSVQKVTLLTTFQKSARIREEDRNKRKPERSRWPGKNLSALMGERLPSEGLKRKRTSTRPKPQRASGKNKWPFGGKEKRKGLDSWDLGTFRKQKKTVDDLLQQAVLRAIKSPST